MRRTLILAVLLAACEGDMPPPPVLTLTSPARATVQQSGSQITVTGTALPNANGDPVTNVTVNNVAATLAADGTFSATLDAPDGAMLIETVASSAYGGTATDARAVHVGKLQPVGTVIDNAVTAALSTDAFTRLATAAGGYIMGYDLNALVASTAPFAFSDSAANAKVTLKGLALAGAKITLTPGTAGLGFSAELDGVAVTASVDYTALLIISGTTVATFKADKVTLSGTLDTTPAGTSGFSVKVASPNLAIAGSSITTDSGLINDVVSLLSDQINSVLQSTATTAAETALQPLINDALGALAKPQTLDVLGKKLDLVASPSSVTFSPAGALVNLDLGATIEGSESSPGFIITPNGMPTMSMQSGIIELGLADDLVNELLAEIHALGLLDLHIKQDFGLFDQVDIKLGMPPMVSANNADGSLRLILGDMLATFTDHGTPLSTAAINAQVDLTILRGATPQQIALQFGDVKLWVNVIGASNPDAGGEIDLSGAAAAGIGVQLDSLSQFLVTVPLPSVAGVSFDNLEMHADSGYLLMSGVIH